MTQGVALDENSVTRSTARLALERYLPNIPACPNHYSGRGIVIGASGLKYFVCAWVCLRMLRHLGCKLPVELWHQGNGGWNSAWSNLVEPYDVSVIDASEMLKRHPADIAHP